MHVKIQYYNMIYIHPSVEIVLKWDFGLTFSKLTSQVLRWWTLCKLPTEDHHQRKEGEEEGQNEWVNLSSFSSLSEWASSNSSLNVKHQQIFSLSTSFLPCPQFRISVAYNNSKQHIIFQCQGHQIRGELGLRKSLKSPGQGTTAQGHSTILQLLIVICPLLMRRRFTF